MKTKLLKNLGPLSETPCRLCGRRHHLHGWPQKCYDFEVRSEYAAELKHDRASWAEMCQEERDAHDNL